MLRRLGPFLLFLLLPAIPLWRCVVYGETIGTFDQIRQMPPWNGPTPTKPWDVLMVDSVLQFYPWRELVLESWGRGEIPTWNPYELAGTPLLANSQSGALYPPHVLFGVLHVPTPIAIVLLAWLHLAWAGWGTFLLCRRIGASVSGALIGGISFGMCTFMIAWTALPSVISTCAWIPWCLWAALGILDNKLGKIAVEQSSTSSLGADEKSESQSVFQNLRSKILSVLILAICIAMMLLAGHLQFAAYGLMAVGFISIWKFIEMLLTKQSSVWLRGGLVGFGLVLGFAFAAPQLLPVLEYGKRSSRASSPTDEGYQAYLKTAIPIREFFARIANPFAMGDPTMQLSAEIPVSTYTPAIEDRGANFAERASTVGPLVFMLSLISLCTQSSRKLALPFALLGLIALLIAIGTPLNALLYFGVPNWSATGSPGRITVLVMLAMCVSASLWNRKQDQEAREFMLFHVIVIFGIGIACLLLDSLMRPAFLARDLPYPHTTPPLILYAIFIVLFLMLSGVLPGYASERLAKLQYPLGIVILATIVLSGGTTWLIRTGNSLETANPTVNENRRIAVINENWELLVATPGVAMPPNTATLMHIPELGGYDSILDKETVAILRDINGQDPAPPANGNLMFIKPTADPKKLVEAGVTEVWSAKPMAGFGEPISSDENIFRYQLDGPGIASAPSGPAIITKMTSSGMNLTAEGPGPLTVRVRNLPGWQAKIDGKEAKVGQGNWVELNLPEGKHAIELKFDVPLAKFWFVPWCFSIIVFVAVLLPFRRTKSVK